jgi:hypothetical protein
MRECWYFIELNKDNELSNMNGPHRRAQARYDLVPHSSRQVN